jgi:hypothetical protein
VLKLSNREFYELTPRQYHLLLDKHREQIKHTEWLTGVIASAIANWSHWAPEVAMRPMDFALPTLRGDRRLNRAPRLNRKTIAADIRAAFDREKARANG